MGREEPPLLHDYPFPGVGVPVGAPVDPLPALMQEKHGTPPFYPTEISLSASFVRTFISVILAALTFAPAAFVFGVFCSYGTGAPAPRQQSRTLVIATEASVPTRGTRKTTKNTPIPKSGKNMMNMRPKRGAMRRRASGEILK